MSLSSLVGMKQSSPTNRTPMMESWFEGTAVCDIKAAAPEGTAVNMVKSIRHISRSGSSSLPPMPGIETSPAQAEPQPMSAYERMENTLSPHSYSSTVLAKHGILDKFLSDKAILDIAMAPDGSLTACVRSPDGYRRTVICRQNGQISQRVTSNDGRELVRFASDGKVYLQI